MTTRTKRRLKAFIIRWEMHWYAATALLYLAALLGTWLLFPDVGNLALQLTILFTGLTSTVAAMAGAVKASDTER